jgi:hypothetical protein
MMRRRARTPVALVPLAALACLAGCITNEGTLQIAALEPTPAQLRHVQSDDHPVRTDVVGRDMRITSILIVPTFDGPVLERAAADALAKGGGDLLLGVHVRTIDHWFLVGWSMIEVRGDVVDLRSGRGVP